MGPHNGYKMMYATFDTFCQNLKFLLFDTLKFKVISHLPLLNFHYKVNCEEKTRKAIFQNDFHATALRNKEQSAKHVSASLKIVRLLSSANHYEKLIETTSISTYKLPSFKKVNLP